MLEPTTDDTREHFVRVVYQLGPDGWRFACLTCGETKLLNRIVRTLGLLSERMPPLA